MDRKSHSPNEEQTHQTYRFELAPNNNQRATFARYAGARRFVFNWGLAEKRAAYARGERHPSAFDLRKRLVSLKDANGGELSWLKDISTHVHQCALVDLDQAFANFFAKRAGYPCFKKKGRSRDSFRLREITQIGKRSIKLPRIGWVRLKEPTIKLKGQVLSATVSREADRWFVTLAVAREPKHQSRPKGSRPVGVDLGIKSLAVIATANGEAVHVAQALRPLRQAQKRLKRAQRRLSRKQEGSANRHKQQMRVARLHRRVANQRRDNLHKLTSRLAKSRSVIVVEDLHVRAMSSTARGTLQRPGKQVLQKAGFNRSLLEQSFGELRRQLTYKASWYGSVLVTADRFYPSSKICSQCGAKNQGLRRDDRLFECPSCSASLNRDLNAAINLARLAPLLLEEASSTVRPTESDACGEDGSGLTGLRQAQPAPAKQVTSTRLERRETRRSSRVQARGDASFRK